MSFRAYGTLLEADKSPTQSVNDEFLISFSAGGLVTAVAPVVIKGKGLWVGWPGIHLPSDFNDDDIPESDPNDHTPTAGLKSNQVSLRNEKCWLEKIYNVYNIQ